MVVCLCQGVNEKRVRRAVREGACSRKAVTKACRAGAGCGGCHGAIKDLIKAELAANQAARATQPNAQADAVTAGSTWS